MRRTGIILIALLLGLLLAAPAVAQGRDPFDPQPGSGEGSGGSGNAGPFDPETGGGSTDPDDQGGAGDPGTDDPGTNDPGTNDPTDDPGETDNGSAGEPDDDNDGDVGGTLARTGFDVFTWSGIAYLLIVVGCAALVIGRLFAPAIARRRR